MSLKVNPTLRPLGHVPTTRHAIGTIARHSTPTLLTMRSIPASRPFASSARRPRRSTPSYTTIPNTPIKVFREIEELRQWRRQQLHDYRTVSLVPTMGALHAGHLALMRQAAADTSHVVVSIYVNPAQFGVAEDLDSYPRTWDTDCQQLTTLDRELAEDGGALGRIAAVFAPTTATMYPSGFPGQEPASPGSFVTITPAATKLEGGSRPTFFRGVATVCMKLFHVVAPERVYFGQKDVQQTVIIKKMVKDFLMDTTVVVGQTVREDDGLAMSSRNVYLGARRRAVATILHKTLQTAEALYAAGHRSRDEVLGPALELFGLALQEQKLLPAEQRVLFEKDYISLADPETLEEVDVVDETKGAILSGAIRMLPVESPQDGEDLGASRGPLVRLIDNIILPPVSP